MADEMYVYYEHDGRHEAKRLSAFRDAGIPKSAITGYTDEDGVHQGGVPDVLKAAPKADKPKDDGA